MKVQLQLRIAQLLEVFFPSPLAVVDDDEEILGPAHVVDSQLGIFLVALQNADKTALAIPGRQLHRHASVAFVHQVGARGCVLLCCVAKPDRPGARVSGRAGGSCADPLG